MKRDYNRTEAILMGKDPKDNAPSYSELNCDMKPLSMIRQRYPYHKISFKYDDNGELTNIKFIDGGPYRDEIRYDDEGNPHIKTRIYFKDGKCYMTHIEEGAQYIDTGMSSMDYIEEGTQYIDTGVSVFEKRL